MSTILSTQDRPAPLLLDTRVDQGPSIFSSLADLLGEIRYCVSLSAQSVAFSLQANRTETYSNTTAERLDAWPIDLWVF